MKVKWYWVLAFAIIALTGSYVGIKSLKRSSDNRKEQQRLLMVKGCKQNSGSMAAQYPEITDWYCNCLADTLLKHFNQTQLAQQEKMSLEERAKYLEPLLKELSVEAFRQIHEKDSLHR